jgi:hypothetical protein
MGCPHASTCELYKHFTVAPVLEIWKVRYCASDKRFPTCARHKLSTQRRPVPPNLLPNGDMMPLEGEDPGPGSCGP